MNVKTQAAILTTPGEPDVLKLQTVELPWAPSENNVLVRLKAASVNPADSYFRQFGTYLETDQPRILGHDGAGEVAETSSNTTKFKIGDRVCFCYGGIGAAPGTYSEYAVVPEDLLVSIPDSVSFESAAALPLVSITAMEAMHLRANVQQDEHVLIHAGAGGTGHMAIQFARLRGARVATTISSQDKAEFCESIGATKVIRYPLEDFVTSCADWTDGNGIDVALDNVGTEVMQRTYRAMAAYGRVVTLMGLAGDDSDETAYVSNLTVHNLMMLTPMILSLQSRLVQQAKLVAEAMHLLEQGELHVHISKTFSLQEISLAHKEMDLGTTTGKIIVSIH